MITRADNLAGEEQIDATERIWRWSCGVLLLCAAFGVGSFASGLASWVADGVGAPMDVVLLAGRIGLYAGFVAPVFVLPVAYARRCRCGRSGIRRRELTAMLLALPAGAIPWAVFVDAIAWHRKVDEVRPMFDYAVMPLVLGAAVPLALGMPILMAHVRRVTR